MKFEVFVVVFWDIMLCCWMNGSLHFNDCSAFFFRCQRVIVPEDGSTLKCQKLLIQQHSVMSQQT